MNISQSQVEECFGKGAVRAARVQHAVLSSTCMDWCTAVFTTIIVVCVAAATELIAEQINHLEEQAERVIASIAVIDRGTHGDRDVVDQGKQNDNIFDMRLFADGEPILAFCILKQKFICN